MLVMPRTESDGDKGRQEPGLRRISLMVRADQHAALSEKGLNVSGLVRDLIDDYLSEHTITISVGEETRGLYDQIVANTGSTDEDVEVYLDGQLIASYDGYTTAYALTPLDGRIRELWSPGPHTLAVHCHQTGGGQFIDLGIVEVREAGD